MPTAVDRDTPHLRGILSRSAFLALIEGRAIPFIRMAPHSRTLSDIFLHFAIFFRKNLPQTGDFMLY